MLSKRVLGAVIALAACSCSVHGEAVMKGRTPKMDAADAL